LCPRGRHLLRLLSTSKTTGFPTFPVMAWNTRDGKAIRCFFQAISRRAPYAPQRHSVSTSLCGVCIPFRSSHGVADGRIAWLTKGCIFLLQYTWQYNILDYGVWPEQCGRWAMSIDSSWRRTFTTQCLRKGGKVCRIMRKRPRQFGRFEGVRKKEGVNGTLG